MVVDQEHKLLKDAGHDVVEFLRYSDDIAHFSPIRKVELPLRVTWSWEDQVALNRLLAKRRFDVIHLHNTFPLISPSVLTAARRMHTPVVATLHNYRLVCSAGTLLRDGSPCLKCIPRSPLPSLIHSCYRDSRIATAPLALSIATHRVLRSWQRGVDRFIVMSEFAKGIMVQAGFPSESICIKPHFIPSPPAIRTGVGSYGLFLGRLSVEKGVSTLLDAWDPSLGTMLIAGDGPLRGRLEEQAANLGQSVRFLGSLDRTAAQHLLLNARFLANPSKAFETFGLSVVEAFAHAVPAIVPNQGVFPELVRHNENGLIFKVGDASSLRSAMQSLSDPKTSVRAGKEARKDYLSRFTPAANLVALEAIYRDVIEDAVINPKDMIP